MKILIAPQSYKGSISAIKVAEAIKQGALNIFPDIKSLIIPVADGGDGTLETLVESTNGTIHNSNATGPLGNSIPVIWGTLGDSKTAIIEMARISGLALVPQNKRNPYYTTSYGLGEIIKEALDLGYRKFIIGIGGSATNDGGAGMAQALGAKLTDENKKPIDLGGLALNEITKIDISGIDPRINESEILVACDVNNPLCGPNGASFIYGPQKGASPEMVKTLDDALYHFGSQLIRDTGINIMEIEGSGAAGGIGGGMVGFLDAKLKPGIEIVLDSLDFDKSLKNVDLVITGEGQIDFQTVFSKAPIGVAKHAKKYNIPVIAICGSLGENYQDVHSHGIDAVIPIIPKPMDLKNASDNAYELIKNTSEQIFRILKTTW
ncbi:MAG: glycerate kinase [SAR202 cluster bacterium]|nr:glycerate kinase [SAR202 cluster bacterium]